MTVRKSTKTTPRKKKSAGKKTPSNKGRPVGRSAKKPASRSKTKETSLTERKERAAKIIAILKRTYPDSHCALNFKSPYELSVATILSAQCTDKRVNMVTPELFRRWPDAKKLAGAKPSEIEEVIRSTGFYKNKAKSLLGFAKKITEEHGGNVPKTMEELIHLPGFGRKTANVILGNAWGIPGMVVDTHVGRLSRRMGLTAETDPVKVEFALRELVPEKDWTMFSHWMIDHGRTICDARKPLCEKCPLDKICPRTGV